MYIFITTLQSGPNLIPFTRKLHFISAFNGQSLTDFKEINKRKIIILPEYLFVRIQELCIKTKHTWH